MGQIRQECTVEFAYRGRRMHGEHMDLIDISALSKTRLIHTPDMVVTGQDGEPSWTAISMNQGMLRQGTEGGTGITLIPASLSSL